MKQLKVGDLRKALEGIPDEEDLWTTGYDDGTVSLYWGQSWNLILEN